MEMHELREKVAQFLDRVGFFEKTALSMPKVNFRALGRTLASPKVMAPAALGVGAAGLYGIDRTGQQQITADQEAAQLRQLLEQYPELLTLGLEGQGGQQGGGYADPYAQQQQQMYADPYAQQQQQYADPRMQQQQMYQDPYGGGY